MVSVPLLICRLLTSQPVRQDWRNACQAEADDYSLCALVAPGVPPLADDDAGHVRLEEDDPGVAAPRAAQVRRRDAPHRAALEDEAARVGVAHPALRRDEPGPHGRRRRPYLAALEDGLAVAEDEVHGALDVAALVVVPPLDVAQRVLDAHEAAPVEGRPVARHQRRHRRRDPLPAPVVRVLRATTDATQFVALYCKKKKQTNAGLLSQKRRTDLEGDVAGHEVGGVRGERRGGGGARVPAGVVRPLDRRLLPPLAFQQDEALVLRYDHLLTWCIMHRRYQQRKTEKKLAPLLLQVALKLLRNQIACTQH